MYYLTIYNKERERLDRSGNYGDHGQAEREVGYREKANSSKAPNELAAFAQSDQRNDWK